MMMTWFLQVTMMVLGGLVAVFGVVVVVVVVMMLVRVPWSRNS